MSKSSAALMEKAEGSALQMFYLKPWHHKNLFFPWETSAKDFKLFYHSLKLLTNKYTFFSIVLFKSIWLWVTRFHTALIYFFFQAAQNEMQ